MATRCDEVQLRQVSPWSQTSRRPFSHVPLCTRSGFGKAVGSSSGTFPLGKNMWKLSRSSSEQSEQRCIGRSSTLVGDAWRWELNVFGAVNLGEIVILLVISEWKKPWTCVHKPTFFLLVSAHTVAMCHRGKNSSPATHDYGFIFFGPLAHLQLSGALTLVGLYSCSRSAPF